LHPALIFLHYYCGADSLTLLRNVSPVRVKLFIHFAARRLRNRSFEIMSEFISLR
jgi:hypothetical protein